jgi:hypothetical protein
MAALKLNIAPPDSKGESAVVRQMAKRTIAPLDCRIHLGDAAGNRSEASVCRHLSKINRTGRPRIAPSE